MNIYSFFKQCFNSCVMAIVLMALSFPVNAYFNDASQSCCVQSCPAPCQTENLCCFDRTKIFLSALAIGAAAGAGTGYLAGHHHKSCKNKCDTDLCICKKDLGQTLTFNITLEFGGVMINDVDCIAIVNTPDGCTMQAVATKSQGSNQRVICSGSIKICDPECGTYHIGMDLNLSSAVEITGRDLIVIVDASRPDQSTTLETFETRDLNVVNIQTNLDYIYDPQCCVKTSCKSNGN